tara:strand:+ start:412 stop:756 length:345 start_codon:yes stop_codon:yes gene_type:complete
MKSTELKNMIKAAVKEAIHEELKDILLEAVRAPKQSPVAVVQESVIPTPTPQSNSLTQGQQREAYQNILGDTAKQFSSQNVPSTFQPGVGYDSSNGTLPAGEVDMSMIAGLMKR